MKLIFLTLSSFLLLSTLSAQDHRCGTNETLIGLGEEEMKARESFESYYQSILRNPQQRKKEPAYVIPIVFHIIHQNGTENVSDQAIEGLVKQINDDFNLNNSDTSSIGAPFKKVAADMQIEFKLARKNPNGACTNGITRTISELTNNANDQVKNLVKWDNTRYLNVWVVKSVRSSGEGTTLGYAYYPGTSSRNDGIVMRSDQMGSNTLTHEIGHYLNLMHTFDGACSGGTSSDCSRSGDRVCDTPPTADQNFRCPRSLNSCSNDFPDLRDQIENYMDYSDCSAMFTAGQRERMHSAIDFFRSKLVSKANLAVTGVDKEEIVVAPKALFEVDRRAICANDQVQFSSNSCQYSSSTKFAWKFEGPVTLESSEESPLITFQEKGSYSVELTVTNDGGTNSKKIDNLVVVHGNDQAFTAPFTELLNADDLPENWALDYESEGLRWEHSESGYGNSNALFVDNYHSPATQLNTSISLPPVDISASNDQFLRYHLAYTEIEETSLDRLNIRISSDCGESWKLIRSSSSKDLISASKKGTPFVPGSGDWTLQEVDLSRYADLGDLMVQFEFVSGGGNNLYIDNVTIGTSELGISDLLNRYVNLYPNPVASGSDFSIDWYTEESFIRVQIIDLSGRVLKTFSVQNTNSIRVSTKGFYPGVYQTILTTEHRRVNQRIVIQ